MSKQDEQALLDRVAALELLTSRQRDAIHRLEARLEARIRQHDATLQMHCDHALAMRQITSALEDIVRRGTK